MFNSKLKRKVEVLEDKVQYLSERFGVLERESYDMSKKHIEDIDALYSAFEILEEPDGKVVYHYTGIRYKYDIKGTVDYTFINKRYKRSTITLGTTISGEEDIKSKFIRKGRNVYIDLEINGNIHHYVVDRISSTVIKVEDFSNDILDELHNMEAQPFK